MPLSDIVSGDAAAGGVIGIVIAAGGAVAIKLLMARHQISQDERKDLRDEWRELANRQQTQIDALQLRIIALEKDKEECHRDNAILRTRVAVLEAEGARSAKGGR